MFLEHLFIQQRIKFLVDKNVRLIHRWGKETDLNHLSIDQIQKKNLNSKQILSLISIGSFKTPIYGLTDKSNKDIPFSYILLPPQKDVTYFFTKMMKDKVGKKY